MRLASRDAETVRWPLVERRTLHSFASVRARLLFACSTSIASLSVSPPARPLLLFAACRGHASLHAPGGPAVCLPARAAHSRRYVRQRVAHMDRRGDVQRVQGAKRAGGCCPPPPLTLRSDKSRVPRAGLGSSVGHHPGERCAARGRVGARACPLAPRAPSHPSPQGDGFTDDNVVSQKRAWLFASYLGCFAALGGALASYITFFGVGLPQRDHWVGAALIIQVMCILVSGMVRAVGGCALPLTHAVRPPARSSTGSQEHASLSTSRIHARIQYLHSPGPASASSSFSCHRPPGSRSNAARARFARADPRKSNTLHAGQSPLLAPARHSPEQRGLARRCAHPPLQLPANMPELSHVSGVPLAFFPGEAQEKVDVSGLYAVPGARPTC